MKLTPPKKSTFYVALLLAVLALVGTFVAIPVVSTYAFWLALAAYVVLAAGNYVKGF
jgi:hypothetical protein